MTEVDLIEQVYASGDMVWSLLQYWTSVSFGILIAAHLAAKKLNWVVLGVFITLYTLFTLNLLNLVMLQVGNISSIGQDLQLLSENGVQLSSVARNILEDSPVVNQTNFDIAVRRLMALGMYLITIGYAVYCKLKPDE